MVGKVKKDDISLEDGFVQLEEIMKKLEQEDITLEESFQTYQKGMELIKHCNNKIEKVEKKVLALNKEGEWNEF